MFKITIEGSTMSELAANALALAAQFQTTAPEGNVRGKAVSAKKATASAPAASDSSASSSTSETSTTAQTDVSPSDEVDRELLAEVEPAPATANSIVDAGTGAPAAPQTKKITMDDVRASATELAGKDTPKLKELITKHGGTKLSDIPPANLPGFYGDVLEAIG